MNIKRILSWGAFVVVVGLIVWGMVLAGKKAERESMGLAPVDEVTATDWTKGAEPSDVVLIEYSDLQCPACASYFPLVEEVVEKNSDKVKFVYRHFPLSQHLNAVPAAQAVESAGIQGKFWEMYELLFTKQKDWEFESNVKDIFVDYATDLGLDIDQFLLDYNSPEVKEKINDDAKSGFKAGVNSTPTFFLNGKRISPTTYDEFKKLIDEASGAQSFI